MSKIRFNIITIFPKIFDSYFSESIIKRAILKKKVEIKIHNLRDFSADKKHHKVDDRPFGGGAGMVLMAGPILRAVEKIQLGCPTTKLKIAVLSVKGKQFNQKIAHDWSKKYSNFIFVTGRYEGIDERVITALRRQPCAVEEISIGPYITTDGDVAAMVVVSALTRLIPGVIQEESLKEESFNPKLKTKNIKLVTKNYKLKTDLEYPHYTRPEVFKWRGKKYPVPKILLSGNHAEIEKWRNAKRGGVKMRKARR
uniref:tRNA (guanine-N(1)-)-methyltransferase n=1 Tax=Candidatus Giovannonibacteria bacterium GW2011_GWF2_42_19 TaxID=1618659 RepID=A0A0G1CHC7_9BACT|nr:MAG: tRNA (guanine-N(1)-)-methyltransferase [Candidatus Giovannonibacteria bacterium GW2011_GWF2_42_19]